MDIPQIAPADIARQADALKAQGLQPVLLDVREPDEWAMASVAESTVPALRVQRTAMQTVPGALGTLDAAQPVFVLCHHGMRSQQVALFLRSRGFEQVYNVAGGIDAWSRTVDPTVPRY